MFGSQILDVAIGLIFIFLVLSLAVTALNEFVAALFKRRSKTLWTGVVRLLGDTTFAKTVCAHPLISSLSQSDGAMPSYIPSHTFALAVLDGLTAPGSPPPANLDEVKLALGKLSPQSQDLKTALTVLLNDAPDMEGFIKGVERWFDNTMDRVSGWYKRRTQWILLVMAAGLTLWTNADAIALVNTLWRDPALRSALVAQAQEYVGEQRRQNESAAAEQPREGPPPPPIDPPSAAEELDDASAKLDKSLEGIRGLGVPLGWRDPANSADQRESVPGLALLWPTFTRHGLGWLLTALAISLGAPFWFDMLNKVVSIRASGKSPEEKRQKQVPAPAGKAPG